MEYFITFFMVSMTSYVIGFWRGLTRGARNCDEMMNYEVSKRVAAITKLNKPASTEASADQLPQVVNGSLPLVSQVDEE